jgi:ABC-2 type transport system permease protein
MNRWFGWVSVLLACAWHQILVSARSWHFHAMLTIVQPGVLLLVTLSLPRRSQVTTYYASQAALGVLLVSFWSGILWTGATILRRERAEGTLASCLTGVRDLRLVLVGKLLGTNAISVVVTTLTVITVLAALRQPVRFDHVGWLVVGLLALLASGLILGLGMASLFVLSRFGPQLSGALMYPVFLLAGLLTPLSVLPSWIRWLSFGISLRWTKTFLSSTIQSSPDLPALGMVVVLSAGYAIAAAVAFRRFAAIALKEGTIDFV